MIIVDRAMEERAAAGNPVRVAMVGAGAMGRGIARQLLRVTPGLRLVVVANRTLDNARRAYTDNGADEPTVVGSTGELDAAIAAGRFAITDDPRVVAEAAGVDAIIEVTGTIDYAARLVLDAFANGKPVVLMNAELDGTVGPILKARADAAGVIYSGCDGDQPGVQMNLYRFVRSIGLKPLVVGNIKGLHDRFRNPTTQEGYAKTWKLSVPMVTSFADGTKVSFEQAVVANATGFRAPRRGLYGWDHQGHVDELATRYDIDELEAMGGIVDYVVGASPPPGIYVIGAHRDPYERHVLKLYKKGDGPLYTFYTPQHLCHFEVPISVARVALHGDSVFAPLGGPIVEVVATAKKDLRPGDEIDGIGGYAMYGQCENADVTARDRLLPVGVAIGSRVIREVATDAVLTYDDVELPPGRLVDTLRREQDEHFAQPAAEGAGLAGAGRRP
jgi:predicted homoserine dehydrogenase-like protein